jgi:N-acetylmuramoyl-L-alanine amidase
MTGIKVHPGRVPAEGRGFIFTLRHILCTIHGISRIRFSTTPPKELTMKIRNKKLVGDNGNNVAFKKSPNQGGTLSGGKPRFIVIHYTAGGTASGAIATFANAGANVSAHLVIDHDGTITQMVDLDRRAFHAGASRWRGVNGLNGHSVGIEIVNWGKLKKSGSGGWVSWANAPVPDSRVILEEHKHFPGQVFGWEAFDHAQFVAAIGACQALVEEYGIKPWDLIGHDDISPFRKVDPGPAFDMDAFRQRVFGRDEDTWNTMLFKVSSPSGLNMRTAPTVSATPAIKNLHDGTVVHALEKTGLWWLVAEVIDGNDDVTGYVHSGFLEPLD